MSQHQSSSSDADASPPPSLTAQMRTFLAAHHAPALRRIRRHRDVLRHYAVPVSWAELAPLPAVRAALANDCGDGASASDVLLALDEGARDAQRNVVSEEEFVRASDSAEMAREGLKRIGVAFRRYLGVWRKSGEDSSTLL